MLVKGSQVWSEPRAISVLIYIFIERGMLIHDGEESTFKEDLEFLLSEYSVFIHS